MIPTLLAGLFGPGAGVLADWTFTYLLWLVGSVVAPLRQTGPTEVADDHENVQVP